MILLKRKGKKIIGTMKKNVLIINHDVEKNTQKLLNGDEGNGEDSEGK